MSPLVGRTYQHANRDILIAGNPLPVHLCRSRTKNGVTVSQRSVGRQDADQGGCAGMGTTMEMGTERAIVALAPALGRPRPRVHLGDRCGGARPASSQGR
jgi:hypothetical protein